MNRTRTLCCTALLGLAFALPSLAESERTAEKSQQSLEAEITARVEAFHAASTAGNLNAIKGFISHSPDSFFLASDADEIFYGYHDIVQWWADLFAFFGGLGYPNGGLQVVSDGSLLQVRRVGNLVLVADEALWHFNGGDVTFRLTLVMRKEQGEWKILQGHFSNPLPNGDLPL